MHLVAREGLYFTFLHRQVTSELKSIRHLATQLAVGCTSILMSSYLLTEPQPSYDGTSVFLQFSDN